MYFCLVVSQIDSAPHSAREQHGILTDDALRYVYKILVDGGNRPPILVLRFYQSSLQTCDHGMAAVFPDVMPDFLSLRPVDESLFQPSDDLFHVLMEGILGAVVVDKVLQNIARKLVNTRVNRMSLVDDLASEDLFEL